MSSAHLSQDFIEHVISRPLFVAWITGAPLAGVMAIRWTLASRQGQFRIALLPTGSSPEAEASLETG